MIIETVVTVAGLSALVGGVSVKCHYDSKRVLRDTLEKLITYNSILKKENGIYQYHKNSLGFEIKNYKYLTVFSVYERLTMKKSIEIIEIGIDKSDKTILYKNINQRYIKESSEEIHKITQILSMGDWNYWIEDEEKELEEKLGLTLSEKEMKQNKREIKECFHAKKVDFDLADVRTITDDDDIKIKNDSISMEVDWIKRNQDLLSVEDVHKINKMFIDLKNVLHSYERLTCEGKSKAKKMVIDAQEVVEQRLVNLVNHKEKEILKEIEKSKLLINERK